MKRIVEPELLDELSPGDPRAIRSRSDLRRVNFFMGNVGIIERILRERVTKIPRRMVELGAGDGTFLLKLAGRLSQFWPNLEIVLVDQQNLVRLETRERFEQLGWRVQVVEADVFDWIESCETADCMMANLFLHHFDDDKLAELLRLASGKTNLFLACEPRRSAMGVFGTQFLRLIGCNDVTRHDAAVSVRAGFLDSEITKLWPPQNRGWETQEKRMGWFSQSFVSVRL